MQTITITLTVPDGVRVAIDAGPPQAIESPQAEKPNGPTLEELKKAFLEAVRAGKKTEAFAAMGAAKCSEVPESNYASVIDALASLVTAA